MHSDAQRRAIAKVCPRACSRAVYRMAGAGHVMDMVEVDPLTDLNAMHEAEKILTEDQMDIYCNRLFFVLPKPKRFAWRVITTTAAQRAEAFLRTLNLWKD